MTSVGENEEKANTIQPPFLCFSHLHVNVDMLNYEDIKKLVLSFGYLKYKCLWYQHPKYAFQHGLKPLNNDGELLELVAYAKGCTVVDIFVEHEVDIPEVVDFCDEGPFVDELSDEEDGGSSDIEEVIMEEVRGDGEKEYENAGTTIVRNEDVGKEGGIGEGIAENEDVGEKGNAKIPIDGETFTEAENAGIAEVRNEDVGKEGNVEVNQDAEEDGYLSEEDEDYVASEGESEYDTDFDIGDDREVQWDWKHELPKETFVGSNQDGDNEGNETQAVYEGSSQDESDLHTPVESDDEVVHKRKFPTFKFPKKGHPVRSEMDMQFASKALVKDVVKDHAMETRTNLWFKKNDAVRLVVKCLLTCPYHMLISKRSGSQYW